MTDTTAQHIAARNDEDLRERLVAVAEQQQIPNAAGFVEQNLGRLVSTDIGARPSQPSTHTPPRSTRTLSQRSLLGLVSILLR